MQGLELVRSLRQPSAVEVLGRSHCDDMKRRQSLGHHPGCEFHAAADGGIEAFSDQIDLPILEAPVDLHVG